jgi:hypothetical protein
VYVLQVILESLVTCAHREIIHTYIEDFPALFWNWNCSPDFLLYVLFPGDCTAGVCLAPLVCSEKILLRPRNSQKRIHKCDFRCSAVPNPLPLAQVMDLTASKALRTGRINQMSIGSFMYKMYIEGAQV